MILLGRFYLWGGQTIREVEFINLPNIFSFYSVAVSPPQPHRDDDR